MKTLSIEEFKAIKHGYTVRGRKQVLAAQYVREFLRSGSEVVELEPKDFELDLDEFSGSQAGYIKKTVISQITALGLESCVECYRCKQRVFLVRIDI